MLSSGEWLCIASTFCTFLVLGSYWDDNRVVRGGRRDAAAVTTGLWSPSVDVELSSPPNLATRCSGRCVAEWGRGAERWRTRRSAVSCAAGRVATSVVSSAALAGDPMGDGST